ncbi:Pre-rRNA-processing protein ipi3 [Vermiconidia calcicola]|uniref:Pre-rRNA-processing protein ipi3 n=1 Tax=Vermiconidia calcicola TaxID=1690605 RepID=A0ACC3N884_9PEZI|nr:Pre-rRNA-processing protein ipi3 [Vermiconidia calcicola]
MLSEHFVASIGVPLKPPASNVAKDAAIFIHEFQPLQAPRTIFKKSATPTNCLAVSRSHIFAAQAEKAVVHVYSREKGNQEATVPFTERITSIALACDETVLVLGTAEGRLFLWEVASGRQISTTQAHLQSVTKVVVDPTQNFLLSASKDSTVHLWSLPALLSFSNAGVQPSSPIRTFTSHRAEVNALDVGHSSSFCNIAVSASQDKTCFVWDYHTNTVLRTYLLPAVPTCQVLDAADRAVYVGYEDRSVQQLSLYSVQNVALGSAPIQPPASSRWLPSDKTAGAVLSVGLSFDGCSLLTGHESGSIFAWDVAKAGLTSSLLQAPLPGPVTNLSFLPISGFTNESHSKLKVPNVVKPKFGAFDNANGAVPGNYTLNVELNSNTSALEQSSFQETLTAASFPVSMLDEGLSELLSWRSGNARPDASAEKDTGDFMALEDESEQPRQLSLEEQNVSLQAELEALRSLQRASFEKMDRINAERKALLEREQKRLGRRMPNGTGATNNGADRVDVDVDDSSSSDG